MRGRRSITKASPFRGGPLGPAVGDRPGLGPGLSGQASRARGCWRWPAVPRSVGDRTRRALRGSDEARGAAWDEWPWTRTRRPAQPASTMLLLHLAGSTRHRATRSHDERTDPYDDTMRGPTHSISVKFLNAQPTDPYDDTYDDTMRRPSHIRGACSPRGEPRIAGRF